MPKMGSHWNIHSLGMLSRILFLDLSASRRLAICSSFENTLNILMQLRESMNLIITRKIIFDTWFRRKDGGANEISNKSHILNVK